MTTQALDHRLRDALSPATAVGMERGVLDLHRADCKRRYRSNGDRYSQAESGGHDHERPRDGVREQCAVGGGARSGDGDARWVGSV